MTAITTRPVRDPQAPTLAGDSLLRFALRADATLCGALGLFVAMAADPLSRLSGLSATSEWIAGAALVVYGVALYAAAGIPDVRRVGVGVLAGNVAFAVLVAVVLIAGWLPLTGTRRRGDDRVHRRHVGLRLRPVPRGAPSGVTPSCRSGGGTLSEVAASTPAPVSVERETNEERKLMTAITTPRLKESTDSLLRFAMRADAVLTGLAGIAGIPLAGWLRRDLGNHQGVRILDERFFTGSTALL